MTVYVTGVKELDRNIEKLTEKVQKKVATAAVRKGLQAAVKGIKAEIPSKYKDARKAVGWSFKVDRSRKSDTYGQKVGKVGSKVGKKLSKLKEWGIKQKEKRKSAGKRGAGIGPNNLHWFITGTRRMKPKLPGLATRGMRSAKSQIGQAVKKAFADGIRKEALKL